MPRPRNPVPTYRLHKPTGQAVCTILLPDGRRVDVYLGRFDSADSRRRYAEVIADPLTAAGWQDGAGSGAGRASNLPPGQAAPSSVAEVLLAFVRHATVYYADPETGRPSSQLNTVKLTVKAVREMYAQLPAAGFRPPQLLKVREQMVGSGLTRKEVNRRIGVVKQVFAWAAGEADLIPAETAAKLRLVKGLRSGRTTAPDRPRVRPADPAHVEAVLPILPPPVAAVVRLMRLSAISVIEECVVIPSMPPTMSQPSTMFIP